MLNRLRRLPPKPRVGDNVEMFDLSKMFGRVIKIVDNETVEVEWADKEPRYKTKEKIKSLALTKRV